MRILLITVVSWLIWVAPAAADSFTGQQTAPGIITVLVERAETYWHQHGLNACPQGVTAWQADDLTRDDGSAWGRGDGATCEIWVSTGLIDNIEMPAWTGNLIAACTAVVHEVGHAYGLGHTATGVMAGSGSPPTMYGWSPDTCFRWGRFYFSAIRRGDGYTEREIRRSVRADMRLIRHR